MTRSIAAFVRRNLGSMPPWGWAVCLLLFAIGLFVTLQGYSYAKQLEERTVRAQFEREIDETMEEVSTGLEVQEQILLSAAALLESDPVLSQVGWHHFVKTIRLVDRYPSVKGIGYVRAIRGAAQMRSYLHRPETSTGPTHAIQPPGTREQYAPLTLVSPMDDVHAKTLGWDLMTEPVPRQALERARDSGVAVMTGGLGASPLREGTSEATVMMLVPVYQQQQVRGTLSHRRGAIQGWIYSQVDVPQFLKMVDGHVPDMALELYDGRMVVPSKRLHQSRTEVLNASASYFPTYQITRTIVHGQREWTMRFTTLPSWDAARAHRAAPVYLVTGLCLTLGATGFLAFLIGHRAHALRLVQQATRALGASESKYKQLVETQNDLIAVIALDGTLRYVNQALARFLGRTSEDLVGRCLYDLVWTKEAAHLKQHVAQLLDQHVVASTEHRVIDASGQERWISWTSTLQESQDDANLQVHLAGRDMTDRHQLEVQLKDREQRYRGLFEHLQGGFVLAEIILNEHGLAKDFRLIAVNSAFEQLTGWRSSNLIGRTIRELNLVDAEELELWIKGFGRVALGKGNLQFERFSKTFNVWLDIVAYRPAPLQFALVIQDTTERHKAHDAQRAQAEAEAANLAKTQFLANMSHEIRTPLNAVLGFAQIGVRNHSNDVSGELFGRIRDAGKHLLGVINDVLDFAKVESGKLEVDTHPTAWREVVQHALELLRIRAEEKGLTLMCDIPDDLPDWIQVDGMRLEQILVNLLSNAVKFTQRGVVALEVEAHGPVLEWRVRDTGVGMTEEQAARVFSPFEQADKSVTRQFGGTGLGLSISSSLAQIMGGSLTVSSEVGKGSCFTLSLPFRRCDAPDHGAGQADNGAAVEQLLKGRRILVVDDVEVNRMIIEDMLMHRGAEVTLADDGQEAVDIMQSRGAEHFDVILMDLQMPIMDGFTATMYLRKMAPQLPVIALTAHAFNEERERCVAAGMVDHVSKPVEELALIRAVAAHCGASVDDAHIPTTTPVAALPTSSSAEAQVTIDVDWAALVALYGKKPGLLKKAVESVLQHNAQTGNKLRQAVEEGDTDTLVFVSHSLKGVAGNIKAPQLRELASETEQAGRQGLATVSTLSLQLADSLEQTLVVLREYLSKWLEATETPV